MRIVRIVVPLPLRSELRAVEVIGGLGPLPRLHARIPRNRTGGRGLTGRRALRIGANYRPVIIPMHRLKVNDPAVRSVGLEVHEPSLAVRRFYITALMRTVDVGRALREHHAVFIRAVDLPRAQHRLRTSAYAADGRDRKSTR